MCAWGQQPQTDELSLVTDFQNLLEDYVTLPVPPIRGSREQIEQWRDEIEPRLNSLVDKLNALARRAERPPDVLLVLALCHAKRGTLWLERRRELDAQFTRMRGDAGAARTEELSPQARDLALQRSRLSDRVANEYETIERILREALAAAEALRERREVDLVRGVVLAQSAIVRDRAIDAAEAAGETVQIEPGALRRLLDEAQQLITRYLQRTPPESGLEWVRGQFYLGVVEYRRSLTQRRAGEEYFTKVDDERVAAFDRAREIFTSLSDPAAVLAILRPQTDPQTQRESPAGQAYESSGFRLQSDYSYEAVGRYYAATANLYLGLIAAIDPQYVEQAPTERLSAAQKLLDRAKELDFFEPQPGQAAISLTAETIPASHGKVLRELRLATQAVARRKPLNDLTFTFGAAAIWDTNVPLLGRNTEPPLGKSRKRDFRGASTFRINYVADLDVFDPGNTALQKWQLLLEGRVSPTWNVRVRDFNEQFYGGTFNLRYELIGADKLPAIDAVYLNLRYDYDSFLLNNEGFLRINRLRPSAQVVAFDDLLNASLFFTYEDRNYLETLRDEHFDRDGNYFAWGADARFDLGRWVDAEKLWGAERVWGRWGPQPEDRDYERPLEAFIGLEFTTNSTQGSEFDYQSQILSGGVVFPFPYGVDFSYRTFFEWQDYRGHSSIDQKRRGRHDAIQEHSFRAERRFYLTDYDREYEFIRPLRTDRVVMTLYGEMRFTIDDSNVRDRLGQSIFEYNRIVYSAGIRFDIN